MRNTFEKNLTHDAWITPELNKMGRVDWRLSFGTPVVLLLLLLSTAPVTGMFPFQPVSTSQSNHGGSTQGVSGVECGEFNHRCLTGIACANGTCVCPDGEDGDGEMDCVPQGDGFCAVSADPHLTTLSKAHVGVDLPCRYRLVRYVVPFTSAETSYAFCAVEVYATNELNMGRYYVRSMHTSLGVTDSGTQIHHQFEVRKWGVSDDDIFTFQANVTKTQARWGFAQHENVNGVEVFPVFDEDNNFCVLSVPQCNTKIKYRAYNPQRHRQTLKPGVTIHTPKNARFVSQYGRFPHALCGTSTDKSTEVKDMKEELGLKSSALVPVYAILLEAAPQTDNPSGEQCEAAMSTFSASTSKARDLNLCGDIVTDPHIRLCISEMNQDSAPIDGLTACLRYLQGDRDAEGCTLLKSIVDDCDLSWGDGPAISCS